MANGIQEIKPKDDEIVKKLLKSIDLSNSNSIIHFGADAQEEVTTVSSQMLEGVKNKDLDKASEPLSNMIAAIKGFDIDELDPNKEVGFLIGCLTVLNHLLCF